MPPLFNPASLSVSSLPSRYPVSLRANRRHPPPASLLSSASGIFRGWQNAFLSLAVSHPAQGSHCTCSKSVSLNRGYPFSYQYNTFTPFFFFLWLKYTIFFFFSFILFFFYWSIDGLQCVSFRCTAKWFSYAYMYVYIYHSYIYLDR